MCIAQTSLINMSLCINNRRLSCDNLYLEENLPALGKVQGRFFYINDI